MEAWGKDFKHNVVSVGWREEIHRCYCEEKNTHGKVIIFQISTTCHDALINCNKEILHRSCVRSRPKLNYLSSHRKHILYCKDEGPLSVAWDKTNQVANKYAFSFTGQAMNNGLFHRTILSLSVCVILPLQVYLGYNNIAALTVLAERQNWELNSNQNRVKFYNTHGQTHARTHSEKRAHLLLLLK